MKKITLIILVLFVYNCGYSSVYKNQKTQEFRVNIVEINGDIDMNNLIKNEINLYTNKESTNIYDLKIDTNYKKEILTKDSSGVITDYSLSVSSVFRLNIKNINQTFKLEENINIKNQSDNFAQDIYENNIKRNFASSIREKFISKVVNLESKIIKLDDN